MLTELTAVKTGGGLFAVMKNKQIESVQLSDDCAKGDIYFSHSQFCVQCLNFRVSQLL